MRLKKEAVLRGISKGKIGFCFGIIFSAIIALVSKLFVDILGIRLISASVIAMSALKSLGVFSDEVSSVLKDISNFLMIVALAAIGLNTSFRTLKKTE